METFTKQHVGYTGYGVAKYPKGLEGWTLGRLEYGGCNEDCIAECNIWLPPTISGYDLAEQIYGSQKDLVDYKSIYDNPTNDFWKTNDNTK